MEKEKISSDFLPDGDVHEWNIYQKKQIDGLNDFSAPDKWITTMGDIHHVIGELIGVFKDVRRCRNMSYNPDIVKWYDFQDNPYFFTVWGRLTTNLDSYRLYYIVTMDNFTALISVYTCWPIAGKEDYYDIYRWRAEFRHKENRLRRYRKTMINFKGERHIPPRWTTWKNYNK